MTGFDYKVEFAVHMTCNDCKNRIQREISGLKSVQIEDIDVEKQRLVLKLNEDSPSPAQIQDFIEKKLKINAIIRGMGNFFAAVCEFRGSKSHPNVFGVARFIQNENKECLLDAVIDGLKTNETYHLGIHEYGDLSGDNFEFIGPEIIPIEKDIFLKKHKLNLKKKIEDLHLIPNIGRSVAIRNDQQDIISACVMARASKILDNSKKVCACNGKTLWQERESVKG